MNSVKKLMALCLLMGGLWMATSASAADLPASDTPEEQAQPEAAPEGKKEAKDLVLTGDAKCTRCHDETDIPGVLRIGKTKHGTKADSRTPSCTNCHGESETHANKPAGLKERPAPERVFTKRTKTPATERNQACLSCHQGGNRMLWQGSQHATRDVACTSCHEIHNHQDKVRSKQTQTEVCYTCHKEQRVLANKPSHHPVLEGKMACSDCHNPHGSAGPKLMARDTIADTCFTCHMEKRGPFVRKHEPNEDCTICHNPHGTAVDNLLKTRPPYLCQQCHEPSSHQAGIPSFTGTTGISGRGITQARSCLNCHTNIHGSNNPANISNERTFRR